MPLTVRASCRLAAAGVRPQAWDQGVRTFASTSAGPSSSSASPPSPSPSSSSVRPRRGAGRKVDVDVANVDLVGPPDPISRIRPVYYAPIPSTSSASAKAGHPSVNVAADNAREQQAELPHPYSLSEFSQSTPTSRRGRGGRGLGYFDGFRNYVERVRSRTEEAEMLLRVSKISTDNITQRFWRDNNLRFSRDLDAWRDDSLKRIGEPAASSLSSTEQQGMSNGAALVGRESAVDAELTKEESVFYANWLRDNGKRNRAYNVLVWKQAWEQVRLGARATALRNWLKTLQTFGA